MTSRVEPIGIELQTIYNYVDFKEKNVLEIGCGNGRLTFQFADIARKTVAIDLNAESIKQAKKDLSGSLGSKIEFHVQSAENLSFINDTFDIALFSYSLCCMDSLQSMQASMDEVLQKLNPDGFIIILLDSLQAPFKKGTIKYLITKKRFHLVHDYDEDELANLQEAMFVIKHSTSIEKKLDLIAEEEFNYNIVYDTTEEALIDWIEEGYEAYQNDYLKTKRLYEDYLKLDEKIKDEIDRILESMTTPQGVFRPETTVLTVLRKSQI
jgi:ubiquinone/menaquinone biosynthesis C-methylase UbiE